MGRAHQVSNHQVSSRFSMVYSRGLGNESTIASSGTYLRLFFTSFKCRMRSPNSWNDLDARSSKLDTAILSVMLWLPNLSCRASTTCPNDVIFSHTTAMAPVVLSLWRHVQGLISRLTAQWREEAVKDVDRWIRQMNERSAHRTEVKDEFILRENNDITRGKVVEKYQGRWTLKWGRLRSMTLHFENDFAIFVLHLIECYERYNLNREIVFLLLKNYFFFYVNTDL